LGGKVELATAAESAASFDGGASKPTVLQSKYATSTPTAAGCSTFCVAVASAGKLAQAFLDLTIPYTWTAQHTFSSLFATNASSTNATTTRLWVTGVTSSLLKTDSLGQVQAATAGVDYARQRYTFATTSDIEMPTNGFATSTSITIPASVLTASSTIQVTGNIGCRNVVSGNVGGNCTYKIRDANSIDLATFTTPIGDALNQQGFFTTTIVSNGNSISAQKSITTGALVTTTSSPGTNISAESSPSVNFANALTLQIVLSSDNNDTFTSLQNALFVVNP
jgi:hypothetical protein